MSESPKTLFASLEAILSADSPRAAKLLPRLARANLSTVVRQPEPAPAPKVEAPPAAPRDMRYDPLWALLNGATEPAQLSTVRAPASDNLFDDEFAGQILDLEVLPDDQLDEDEHDIGAEWDEDLGAGGDPEDFGSPLEEILGVRAGTRLSSLVCREPELLKRKKPTVEKLIDSLLEMSLPEMRQALGCEAQPVQLSTAKPQKPRRFRRHIIRDPKTLLTSDIIDEEIVE